MTELIMKDFCFEHLDLFCWKEEDKEAYGISSEFLDSLLGAEEKGVSYTLVGEGRILVIGGIVPVSKHTARCFTIFSKYAENHKLAVAKAVRRKFYGMIDGMGLHRVTTYNRLEAKAHHKWCEWLGFKRECIAEKYDDEGNDYVQYGMVK